MLLNGRMTVLCQEACMVWELGMEDLNALLFTHAKLKAQMVEGFHKALQHRMQSNPRTRWSVETSTHQACIFGRLN